MSDDILDFIHSTLQELAEEKQKQPAAPSASFAAKRKAEIPRHDTLDEPVEDMVPTASSPAESDVTPEAEMSPSAVVLPEPEATISVEEITPPVEESGVLLVDVHPLTEPDLTPNLLESNTEVRGLEVAADVNEAPPNGTNLPLAEPEMESDELTIVADEELPAPTENLIPLPPLALLGNPVETDLSEEEVQIPEDPLLRSPFDVCHPFSPELPVVLPVDLPAAVLPIPELPIAEEPLLAETEIKPPASKSTSLFAPGQPLFKEEESLLAEGASLFVPAPPPVVHKPAPVPEKVEVPAQESKPPLPEPVLNFLKPVENVPPTVLASTPLVPPVPVAVPIQPLGARPAYDSQAFGGPPPIQIVNKTGKVGVPPPAAAAQPAPADFVPYDPRAVPLDESLWDEEEATPAASQAAPPPWDEPAPLSRKQGASEDEDDDSVFIPKPVADVAPPIGRRKLGKTNLEVVPVGFATLAAAQQTAIDNAKEVLNAALNAGVNFIDTARSWSKSEEQVGQYIAHRRDEYYLAAKSMKRSGVEIAEDIRQSLIAMRTDHIDLYQIQNLRTREELQEVLSPHGALFALKAARQAGSIRHIGITGYEIPILLEALLTDEFETVQIPFNIVEQDAIKLLFPLAREMNIGVIGMKPLGGGALHNANLALRFVLEHENIAVTVSGMDEVWQVKENLGAIRKFHPLLEDEREALMRLVDTAGRRFCRRCGLCVPCPEDINIPRIFLSYLQYTRQGARRLLPAELAYMQTKSAACTGCGLCESRCPYHLEIRERLQMIKKDLG